MNVEGAEDNDTDGDLAVVISVPEVVPVVVVHVVRAEMQQFAFQTSEVHVASRRGSSQTEADHRFFVQLLAGTGTANNTTASTPAKTPETFDNTRPLMTGSAHQISAQLRHLNSRRELHQPL